MRYSEIENKLELFLDELREQEKADNTIKAYKEDITHFLRTSGEKAPEEEITKDDILTYKSVMNKSGAATSTINRRIISINKLLKWNGESDIATTHTIKQQTNGNLDNVLSVSDYERLLRVALNPTEQALKAGKKPDLQAWVIMQVLANTGIRFSELQFFTVENLKAASKSGNSITVDNKGKRRNIPITKDLEKLLTDYCKQKNIAEGYIFVTRNNTTISNEQISRRLKAIAGYARINKSKVHPHSFRHLFGKTYMQEIGRIDELADIMGHSNIQTTRIYSRTTGKEKADNISSLGLLKKKAAPPRTKAKKK